MSEETNEQTILRRAQAQTLTKIGELVLPWIMPGSLRRDQGITHIEIKNENVQSVHARISRDNNQLIIEILARTRTPDNQIAIIPPGEAMRMSLVEAEEQEEPPDGPTERQEQSLPLH